MEMVPHDALFAQLPTRELVRLMQTCRVIYFLVKDVCFDVDRLLSPFFGGRIKARQFREMQRRTGILISGSTALQLLNRVVWPDADLDIYVPRASAAITVVYLGELGYTFHRRGGQHENISAQLFEKCLYNIPNYLGRGIADVLDFHKGDKKIQVIIPMTSPIEIIFSFHSSCVMNIITPDHAFALYPWSTFVTNEALVIETVGSGQELGRQKYRDRGWNMIESPSYSSKSELGVRMGRFVGDHFTWTVALRDPRPPWLQGAEEPRDMSQFDYLHSCHWQLESDGETTTTSSSIGSTDTTGNPSSAMDTSP
ncbi:hypothetical protein K438DRAFT_1766486 [Mycena galopus ATCC 62051]|nr:hypothetical protein K438DRAFT_1766486 [Mycena galopus ATCC 62051]